MLAIAEINKKNQEHFSFNKAFIQLILSENVNESVLYYGEKKAIENHFSEIKNNVILLREINVVKTRYYNYIKKFICDSFTLIKIYSECNRSGVKMLFFSSFSPFVYPVHRILDLIFPALKVKYVFHGELESLTKPLFSKHIINKLVTKLIMEKNAKSFIILSPHILNKLRDIGFDFKGICIDHPYQYTVNSNSKSDCTSSLQNTFGIVGNASKSKNSEKIFQLADIFEEEIRNKLIEFRIIGNVHDDLISFKNNNVRIVSGNGYLSDSEYYREILGLDYVLFFFGKNAYNLTASGVFFDVLEMEKPIIALKNDLLTYYFNMLGDIGYLCDDINEMQIVLNNIIAFKTFDRYLAQKENIKNAKEILSLNKIGKVFWKQLYFSGI